MIEQKKTSYQCIANDIKHAATIALVSHINPDIDTLSSALWFFELIKANFPTKKIDLICKDLIPQKYTFLKNSHLYTQEFDPTRYDFIVFFDSGSKTQTWFLEVFPELFDGKTHKTLSIDHHIANEMYARHNILNTTYSSTTMIIFEIALLLQWSISADTATLLLAGIYTDTGWLKHSNTTKVTYHFVSLLLFLWANLSIIVDKFFKNNTLSTLKTWWKIINESFIDSKWVLSAYVDQTTLDTYKSNYEDVYGILDYLNATDGIAYTTLLTQKWPYIKASLRTLREDIDLSLIAKKLGGGWHKKASWFTTKWFVFPQKSFQLKI